MNNIDVDIKSNLTICSKCVFYKEPYECYLRCLEKYEGNIDIQKTLEGNTVLVDFNCPYYRSQFEDVVTALDKDNSFPYFIVMNRPSLKGMLQKIIDINRYTVQPTEVIIFIDVAKTKKRDLLINYLCKYANFKWKVSSELVPDTWTSLISDYKRREFMLYCKNLPDLEYDWADKVYERINKKFEKFPYLKRKDAMLIPAALYNRYYFEYTKNVLDKIEEYLCHMALEL